MSNKDDAIIYAMKQEGLLSAIKEDKGGITKYGISLRLLKSIDYHVNDDGVIDNQDVIDLTEEKAYHIYDAVFWVPEYDKILNKILTIYIFDTSINIGHVTAVKLFQRATWAFNQKVNYINDDGIFGELSVKAANSYGIMLMPAFRAERAGYYRMLAEKDKTQQIFLKGWLNRTYAI